MKDRSGYVYEDKKTGKWVARVTFTDATGKRRNVTRMADSITAAREKLKALKPKIEKGEYDPDAERKTFDGAMA